ncbi:hypothetical protein Clacol_009598 [Clathrus columnatus]|uniref:non-specific serine/threonine protein kinase n=1 Tax=Clathrus columnatus TaxID=1419009 RepID=A0AAV5ANF2_9AGAM|nr:hypothetical protein Clacol_009598 [Clathrus columnatus]
MLFDDFDDSLTRPMQLVNTLHSIMLSNSESSPPTLTTEIPGEARGRFTCSSGIGSACEWAEKYRPGRLHPVDLGDKFCDGKYTTIRKLGYGSSSTVWLAVDTSNNSYVAVQVMDAGKAFIAENEIKFNRFLSEKAYANSSISPSYLTHSYTKVRTEIITVLFMSQWAHLPQRFFVNRHQQDEDGKQSVTPLERLDGETDK